MHVRTDDEVYRIDAVWLGPPRATFPWRARYVSYGVGLLVMMLIMFVQRRLGVALDFFSVAWSLVGTVAITRLLGKKITYERPFGQVVTQFWAEVTGPRARTATGGGAIRAAHVRVRPTRGPTPAASRKRTRTGDRRPSVERPVGGAPNGTGTGERAAPQRVAPDAEAWSRRSPAARTGRNPAAPSRRPAAQAAGAAPDKARSKTRKGPGTDRKKGIRRGRA